MKNFLFTPQYVTEGHPNKLCGQVSKAAAMLRVRLSLWYGGVLSAQRTRHMDKTVVTGVCSESLLVKFPGFRQ